MIVEKYYGDLTVRTETSFTLDSMKITQKYIKNGKEEGVFHVRLNRIEMDALIEEYQSEEVQLHFDEFDKSKEIIKEETSLEGIKSTLKSSLKHI